MNNQEAKELLERYQQNQCTAAEIALVETWYLNETEFPITESFDLLQDDLDQIGQQIMRHAAPKRIKLWPRIAAAAAVLLVVAGAWFLVQRQHNTTANVYVNDIAPGSNQAYLTLEDGSRIVLNGAARTELARQQGVKISKTKEGLLTYTVDPNTSLGTKTVQYNTVTTPNGGQFQIELVDGTKVWLNAGSSLTYPSSFANAKQRQVSLKGEAYFEVAKDQAHPFQVKTAEQTVTVLGTHFNINSYADELVTKSTLLEGSVQLNRLSNPAVGQLLKPGEQAILDQRTILVEKANLEEVMAWKNGYFRFNDENIQQVMRKLSRWYNIEVNYEGSVSAEGFNGKISRFNNISQVLNALETTKTVHFKVEGRRVTVIK